MSFESLKMTALRRSPTVPLIYLCRTSRKTRHRELRRDSSWIRSVYETSLIHIQRSIRSARCTFTSIITGETSVYFRSQPLLPDNEYRHKQGVTSTVCFTVNLVAASEPEQSWLVNWVQKAQGGEEIKNRNEEHVGSSKHLWGFNFRS